MADSFDKSTQLSIPNEQLEQAKFLKDVLDRIAVRVGNTSDAPLFTVSAASAATTPKISEIVCTTGVKKTHIFQVSTKRFKLKAKKNKCVIFEYNYDETDYDASKRATTSEGDILEEEGLLVTSLSIFFNVNIDATIEVIEWK